MRFIHDGRRRHRQRGVGGQLGKAGFDVILVDEWRGHVDAINRDGLRFRGANGRHVLRFPAVVDTGRWAAGPPMP